MKNKPNFILIMGDQHRGDCLGIEGRKALETPNLDWMAASGAHFSRAYSTTPTCIPARRTLMSGQNPPSHKMLGMLDGVEWNPRHTLPGELAKLGYQTVLVGRDMHQYPRRKRFGFDYMETLDDYNLWMERNSPSFKFRNFSDGIGANASVARSWMFDEQFHHTNWTVNTALRELDKRDPSCPFFFTISFCAPHPPLTPPECYYNRYMGKDLGEPVIGEWAIPPVATDFNEGHNVKLERDALKSCFAGYYGLIQHLDDQIARILHYARKIPNTWIVYTADHGEMLGDHYLFRKALPYEGSARIPMIIKAPGIEGGLKINSPVGLQDIMPTFIEAAGGKIPDALDGRSLIPVLKNETKKVREFIHGEHACIVPEDHRPVLPGQTTTKNPAFEKGGMHYLTDGNEKYIWYTNSGMEQFFDLVNDPAERINLAEKKDFADRLKLWRSRLIEKLMKRPEGFTDGERLIPGKDYPCLMKN
jgi:arylsulfatase A-like enzyme